MLSIGIIIVSFLTLVTCITIFYIVGALISYNVKSSPTLIPHLFFPYLIKGFLFVISIYAIWTTKGKTILLLVPALLLIISYFEKPLSTDDRTGNIKFKHFILFILSACFLYTIYYAQAFITDGDIIKYAGGDTSFYARAAYNLNVQGIENAKIEYLYPQRFDPEPYHYYDLWFTAFISKITGINTHLVYVLSVYPFFSIVFVTGIWTFCIKYFQKLSFSMITIFASLFAGFKLFYPYFIINDPYIFDYSPSILVKTCFAGCVIIYSMIALQRSDWINLLVTAALFVVGYINLAPAFAVSVFIMLVIGLCKNQITFKFIATPVFLILLQGAYFYYFYKSNSPANLFGEILNLSYFKKSLVLFFEGVIQFFILTPFLILLLLQYRKPSDILKMAGTNNSVLFLLLLVISGVASWGILWGLGPESVQFFYNIFVPGSAIGISFVLLKSINSRKLVFQILGIVAVVLIIVKNYRFGFHVEAVQKKDITKLAEFIKKYEPGLFANIKSRGEFHTFFDKNTNLAMPLPWVGYIDNGYQNYSLNTIFVESDTSVPYHFFEKKVLDEAPFSYFVNQKKIISYKNDLQKGFIISNKVKYLTLSPLVGLENKFNPLIKDSIMLSNGWKVYKLAY